MPARDRAIDGKAILERLTAQKGDRIKVSLYLSKKAYDEFRASCEKTEFSASQVLEELMKEFVESTKAKR